MSNTYFQFKKFIIYQDRCAMKVCTDACILGAWFSNRVRDKQRILDIGSGTGLQMVMLAQKTDSEIDGIEIDSEAYTQLVENIATSPWSNRLTAFEGDARTFKFPRKYDFIISNPPFFENDLHSHSASKQKAMHSTELKLTELLGIIAEKLNPEGSFGVLLPYHRWEYFTRVCEESGFHLHEKLFVRQSPTYPPFRTILHFTAIPHFVSEESELIIRDSNRNYTPEFSNLLSDYYLKL